MTQRHWECILEELLGDKTMLLELLETRGNNSCMDYIHMFVRQEVVLSLCCVLSSSLFFFFFKVFIF